MVKSKLLSLILVTDGNDKAEITLNPEYIESIVDGKPFKHGDTTQVNMISGTKFFVALPYLEVKEILHLNLGS